MMKKFLSRYFPLFPAAAVMVLSFFSHSCANTTQAPTGGPKDTIPPVITKIHPVPGATRVPVHGTEIVFTFDEYVKIKDAKSIFLSPPQKKTPKSRIRGKSIVVSFEEDLKPNTTYTVDLTGAVVDNNEGNAFPGYTTWFSTGEKVDSMFVTGVVRDCNTLEPIKGATVMLYKDQRDSAVFLDLPVAAIKTDDWGYFALRNIQDTVYRVYAVVDNNNNNIYDPDEDKVGFVDTLVRPHRVVGDSIPELMKYDMKDTLSCLARAQDLEMNVFRELGSRQMIMNRKRVSERQSYITFRAQDARIDSLWFKGFPADRIITEFNINNDSLLLWINEQVPMPDSLHLFVNYWKTDSTGVLSPVTEDFKLVDENRLKGANSRNRKINHTDTICQLTLSADPSTFEQTGFTIDFKEPPVLAYFDSLVFQSVNPRQIEKKEKYTISRDTLNLRRYHVMPEITLLTGYDYKFKIPSRTFMDINGHWNDSTEVKVTLPTDEELSSLVLNVSNVNETYIIDLLDGNRTNTLRRYVISSDSSLLFPYLKKGSYTIRVTEDINRNGRVDTGSLLDRRQPEKVKFLKMNGKDVFEIPERSEISQDLDMEDFMKK